MNYYIFLQYNGIINILRQKCNKKNTFRRRNIFSNPSGFINLLLSERFHCQKHVKQHIIIKNFLKIKKKQIDISELEVSSSSLI